jgi:hypothetical protein
MESASQGMRVRKGERSEKGKIENNDEIENEGLGMGFLRQPWKGPSQTKRGGDVKHGLSPHHQKHISWLDS